MSVSGSRPVTEMLSFRGTETKEIACSSARKIQFSPIVKGIIAGLVAALALGIFFGPMAAILGFCVGFASAYFSSHTCTKNTETARRSQYSTPEEIQNDWDGFLKELDESQRRMAVLRERAQVSRALLDSIINPKIPDSSLPGQSSEASEECNLSNILAKIDGDRENRAILRRQAREALEGVQ